jgi:hypothetical protein
MNSPYQDALRKRVRNICHDAEDIPVECHGGYFGLARIVFPYPSITVYSAHFVLRDVRLSQDVRSIFNGAYDCS